MADSESIKRMLRSVLQSCKEGVAISRLQTDYMALCGEAIPVRTLGFSNLEDYLRNIPSVVRLETRQGVLTCFAAVCEETTHIAELVARQKSRKTGRSQMVNCRMRNKPANPYSMNVKPKASLRQPSHLMNWTTNRRFAQSYGVCSASGDVRQINPQINVPVERRHPPAQHSTKPNYVLNNTQNPLRGNQRLPDCPTQNVETPAHVIRHPVDFNIKLEQTRLSQVLSVYSNGLWMAKLPEVFKKLFHQEPHPQTLFELEKWTHICFLEKPSITSRADTLIYPLLSTKSSKANLNVNGSSTSPSSPVSSPLSSHPSTSEIPKATASPTRKQRGLPRNPLCKPTFVFPPNNMGDCMPSVSLRCNNGQFRDGPSVPTANAGDVPLPHLPLRRVHFAQPGPDVFPVFKATFDTTSEPMPDKPAASPVVTVSEDVRQKVKELLLKYRCGLWVHALPKLFEDAFKMPLPQYALDDLSLWLDICSVEYPFLHDKRKAILYYSQTDDLETTKDSAHPLPSGLEIVGSIVPPCLTFPSEQYPSVLVTDAKSCNAITVRFVGKNYSNAQEAMEEVMCRFYNEKSRSCSLSNATVGQLVAVKGDDEDDVARAQVLEIINPFKVKVYYLDHGCTVETGLQNLQNLDQNFLTLPFQAFNVKLAGLEHFGSNQLLLTRLRKDAVGKILLMETLDPCQHNDVPLVVLYDTSQDEDININLSCLKALQDETMNNPLTLNVTYQGVRVTNVCADGILYCQVPSRGMIRLSKFLKNTEAFFKTQMSSDLLVSRPFSGKICLACHQGRWSRVEILNSYGSRVVEVLLIDLGQTVTLEVTELREIPPPFLKNLLIIPPQTVRCKLDNVKVHESGWSSETLKWVKEVVLDREATKITILKREEHKGNRLVYIHLFIGTEGQEVEDSINHQFARSELWQKLETQQISNSDRDKGLSALVERLSLKKTSHFADVRQATKAPFEVMASKPGTLSMPALLELPEPGQNMDVFVPVACHPGYFVLQPWQNLHKLVILMGEMVLYYNKTSKTKPQMEIKKGDIYAANMDSNWHRVLVKGILSNGLISVYELDHGKHELVRTTAVQPLIEEFRQLPFQAITAQLAGSSQLHWSEEASMVFRNHVEKRALVAQVDSVWEAPDWRSAPWERRLTVYLVDTTVEDKDFWIHTVMGDMGGKLSTAA